MLKPKIATWQQAAVANVSGELKETEYVPLSFDEFEALHILPDLLRIYFIFFFPATT